MAFKCTVPGCEDSEKGVQTEAALKSHIRNVHPEYEGRGARKIPIVKGDFTTAELVRRKRMDIMRKASYGIRDKSALTWLSASRTLLKYMACSLLQGTAR